MIPVQGSKDEKEFLREQAAFVEKFSHMLNSQGWKEYEAYVRQEAANALQAARVAQTGDMAMKAVTAYHTLIDLIELPKRWVDGAVSNIRR